MGRGGLSWGGLAYGRLIRRPLGATSPTRRDGDQRFLYLSRSIISFLQFRRYPFGPSALAVDHSVDL